MRQATNLGGNADAGAARIWGFQQWLQRGSEPDAEASRPVRRRQIRRRAAAAGKGLALLADFLARVSVADQGGDGNDGAAGRHGARADVGR